jgi:hypothetical protein
MSGKRVEVTQRDIQNGIRGNARFCPVANALHRHGYRDPTVTKHEIKLPTGEHWPIPKAAADRVRAWDLGGDIVPFSFDMAA